MRRRIKNLDTLRGIAAIAVLIQHLLGHVWRQLPEQTLWLKTFGLDYFDWGRFGVVLFFLISGFVIPFSFSGPRPFRKFVISRFFRLYPAFWISVIATACVLFLSGKAADRSQILANMTMAYPIFREQALSGVYWTLIIEMLFYVVSSGLFLVGALNNPIAVCLLALGGIASAAVPMSANWLWGTSLPVSLVGYHLSFLLLGSLIRQGLERLRFARQAAFLTGMCIAATLPLISGMITGQQTNFSNAYPIGAILAIAAAALVFMVSWTEEFQNPGGIALRLGACSYSIYLFHETVADVVTWLLVPDTVGKATLFMVLVIAITLWLAHLIYENVEDPARRLGQKIITKINAKDKLCGFRSEAGRHSDH